MWVRHQNKEMLGKYDSFTVTGTGIILGFNGPDDTGAVLGKYTNKERALEILDYISWKISSNYKTDEINKGVKSIGLAVFQMPIS